LCTNNSSRIVRFAARATARDRLPAGRAWHARTGKIIRADENRLSNSTLDFEKDPGDE